MVDITTEHTLQTSLGYVDLRTLALFHWTYKITDAGLQALERGAYMYCFFYYHPTFCIVCIAYT